MFLFHGKIKGLLLGVKQALNDCMGEALVCICPNNVDKTHPTIIAMAECA
jgi:hypothetical protein